MYYKLHPQIIVHVRKLWPSSFSIWISKNDVFYSPKYTLKWSIIHTNDLVSFKHSWKWDFQAKIWSIFPFTSDQGRFYTTLQIKSNVRDTNVITWQKLNCLIGRPCYLHEYYLLEMPPPPFIEIIWLVQHAFCFLLVGIIIFWNIYIYNYFIIIIFLGCLTIELLIKKKELPDSTSCSNI
jgi:hypothetical protein